MSLPVLQNTQTNSGTSAASVTVTKPTSLAVDDIMLAYVMFMETGSSGEFVSTPSGWTQLQQVNQNRVVKAIFWKIADSSDVAASNFTFSFSTSVQQFAASISRIDGYASGSEIAHSEIDSEISADATINFTGSAAPDSSDALMIMGFGLGDTASGTAMTVGSYATTPSLTWTEVIDTAQASGSTTITLALAEADLSSTTTTTAYEAVSSRTPSRGSIGSLVIINGPQNATGTHALLESTTTLFSEAAVEAGTTGTYTLLEPTTTLNAPTARATQPTVWTNESEDSTTWTNESSL